MYEELITLIGDDFECNVYKTIIAIRFQELIKRFSSIYSDSIEFIIR